MVADGDIAKLIALLHRLEAWENEQDKKQPAEFYKDGCPEYIDSEYNIKIHDCYQNAGVSEWIDCLKFVIEALK